MHTTEEKRISCKRCQIRKIKCNRTSPCRRCVSVGVKCEYRLEDSKRCPVSREYVSALEAKVANLETFLLNLSRAPIEDRDAIIGEVKFMNGVPSTAISETSSPIDDGFMPSSIVRTVSIPQSIYAGSILASILPETTRYSTPDLILLEVYTTFECSVTNECLSHYFRWQSETCPIVDQGTFWNEYASGNTNTKGITLALVHSLCALGALLSPVPNVRQMANQFFQSAETLLLGTALLFPQVPTAQALLCCAFYTYGRNKPTEGRVYSGMAFSMAQDLLTCTPEKITPEEGNHCTPLIDNESRRRMYTTFYQSDKMFSLMVGRPPVVHRKQPDPLRPISKIETPECLILNKQQELANIIEDLLSQDLSGRWCPSPGSSRSVEISLNDLNARLLGWHNSLPSYLRWDIWGSGFGDIEQNIAELHMLYHTARLSLNQPFLARGRELIPYKTFQEVLRTCDSSPDTIVSILRRFKSQHGLRNAPLLFVHGCIRATDAMLSIYRIQDPCSESAHNTNLQALDTALADLSYAWTLAEVARVGLQNVLRNIEVERKDSQSLLLSSENITPNSDTGLLFAPVQTHGSPIEKYLTRGSGLQSLDTVEQIDFLDLEFLEQYQWDSVDIRND